MSANWACGIAGGLAKDNFGICFPYFAALHTEMVPRFASVAAAYTPFSPCGRRRRRRMRGDHKIFKPMAFPSRKRARGTVVVLII